MIIRAFFMDREVLLNVPNGSLIFDGNAYVNPHEAKWVSLKLVRHAEATLPANDYPIQYDALRANYCWENTWVAKLICIDSETSTLPGNPATDITYITDPNGGNCICGVTCVGTEIQNIPVYNVPQH